MYGGAVGISSSSNYYYSCNCLSKKIEINSGGSSSKWQWSSSSRRSLLLGRRVKQQLHRKGSAPLLYSIKINASSSSSSSDLTSTVGSSHPLHHQHWNFTQRHILLLNLLACTLVAVSATWLLCSAIPALLAFKRAAESMEKLLDVTREELPGTMAAVRLSGMEISDLTMELSDLGQQITQGVKGSTRAVRLAEERLHQLTHTAPSASMQEVATTLETRTPPVTKTARSMKEAVVKARALWKLLFTLTRFSRTTLDFILSSAKS